MQSEATTGAERAKGTMIDNGSSETVGYYSSVFQKSSVPE